MSRLIQPTVASLIMIAALLTGCGPSTPEALVASAKEYLRKDDKKAAVIQLKNALQKKPDLPEARFLLGKTLLETGDVPGAEKELRKALELKYSIEQTVPPLARSIVLLGQHKKVIDEFGKVEMAAPEAKAELQTALGQAYTAIGNTVAAEAAFASALAAVPNYVPAQIGSARIVASTGDFARALEILEAVLGNSSNHADGWRLKGDILFAQDQPDAALAAYRRSLEVKPDFLLGHWAVVSVLGRQNKLNDAAKQLEAMKKIAPNHPLTLYLQALLSYHKKEFAAARNAIQEHLKVLPNLPAELLAGAIELELKSYASAEAHFLKVLQRVPQQSSAERLLIVGYLRSGQPGKALDALTAALDKADKDADMLGLAGEVYMVNGQPVQAAEYFAKASALEPKNLQRRTALALSHMASGETDRAFAELEQTAAMDSGVRPDLALIAAHMQRRDYDKALAAIDRLEKKQPERPLAHNLRGTALLAKNDAAGARRSFERAAQIDPTNFPAAANLSRLDMAEKKPQAARQRFDPILATYPQHMDALLALAELRLRTGDKSDDVVGLIRKAVVAHPTSPGPRLALIGYYVGAKEPKKAVAAAGEALAAIPDRPEVLDAVGRAYQDAGDFNQAVAIYNKLVALQPASPQPHVRLAEVQIAAKNKTAALQSLRNALAIQPDLLDAQRRLVALHLSENREQDAIAIARRVQKQRPKQSIGYLMHGDILAAQKKWADAAEAYRGGLKQVGSTDLAIKLHGAVNANGENIAASQFASAWLRDYPKDDVFRLYLADAATALKDYAVAAQHYRKLLDAHPNNVIVLNNLAWASAQLKDPKALELAEQAHKLAPDQPAVMDTLGVLLVEKGEIKRGLELLRKASAATPQAPQIRLNFAKALIKAGQKDAARKELDELAKLGDKYAGQKEVAQLKQGL